MPYEAAELFSETLEKKRIKHDLIPGSSSISACKVFVPIKGNRELDEAALTREFEKMLYKFPHLTQTVPIADNTGYHFTFMRGEGGAASLPLGLKLKK